MQAATETQKAEGTWRTDQLRNVLVELVKIEMDAINLMSLIREPQFGPDYVARFLDTVMGIQFQIRDFRETLSRHAGEFEFSEYNSFKDYAIPTLSYLQRCATQHVPLQ